MMNEDGASEDWTSYDIRSGYTIVNEFDMALLAKDVVRRNRAIKVMHQYAADMFGIRLRVSIDPVTQQGSIPLGRVISFRNEIVKEWREPSVDQQISEAVTSRDSNYSAFQEAIFIPAMHTFWRLVGVKGSDSPCS